MLWHGKSYKWSTNLSGYKERRDAWGFSLEEQKSSIQWFCLPWEGKFAGW